MAQQQTTPVKATILDAVETKARTLAEAVYKEERRIESVAAQLKIDRDTLAAGHRELRDCVDFLEAYRPLDNTSWDQELGADRELRKSTAI